MLQLVMITQVWVTHFSDNTSCPLTDSVVSCHCKELLSKPLKDCSLSVYPYWCVAQQYVHLHKKQDHLLFTLAKLFISQQNTEDLFLN